MYSKGDCGFQDRSTPPLPARARTTDLLHIKLRKIFEESEATSPMEKLTEGNVFSRVSQEVDPKVPSSSKHHEAIPEDKSAAADDEDLPVTFEQETSSDSSSSEATE